MLSSFELSFYYYYSLLHVPITLCIDSSVVMPWAWFPERIQALVKWHIGQNNDYLLAEKPVWLVVFVGVELTVQLPLFVYFCRQLPRMGAEAQAVGDDKLRKRAVQERYKRVVWWLRLYGVNASVTTLVCLVDIAMRGHVIGGGEPLSAVQKLNLMAVYLPTFLIPLRLCFI